MPLDSIPAPGGWYARPLGFTWVSKLPGTLVAIDVTGTLPGVCASCAGVRPMMRTSESGDDSAASPIVPARWPG